MKTLFAYTSFVRILSEIALLVTLVVVLFGCLGANTTITIRDDGSGEVEIDFQISKLIAHLGNESSRFPNLSLPITREEVTAAIDAIPGASLADYLRADEAEDVVVGLRIGFDDLDTLEALFNRLDGPDLSIVSGENGSTTFELTLYDGLESPPDESVAEMIRAFFSDYELIWTLKAPTDIVTASRGQVDGRTVTVEYDTDDILLSTQSVVWNLDW